MAVFSGGSILASLFLVSHLLSYESYHGKTYTVVHHTTTPKPKQAKLAPTADWNRNCVYIVKIIQD